MDIPLTARTDSRHGIASIALTGELDMSTVPSLEDHLAPFENDGVGTIMVDLRNLAFTDTTGIRALLRARDRINGSGRRFVVIGARSPVRRAFVATGTDSLLDDQDAAGVLDRFIGGRERRDGPPVATEMNTDD